MNMDEGTIALTVMSGLIFLVFLGFLVWGIRSGQFKNVEEAKYRIFRNSIENDPKSNSSEKRVAGERGGENK
jgi:cbb3-type cytochrome oxidase maturation protein